MTRTNNRCHRRTDFIVVACPIDWLLGGEMLSKGARFHRAEAALMVLDGAIPAGAVVLHLERRYLVYAEALHLLDDDGNLANQDDDTATMLPVRTKNSGYSARWEVAWS